MNDHKDNSFAKVVLAGAIGVGAGILLAPKSGKETRDDVKKRLQTGRDRVRNQAKQVKDTAADAIDEATAKSQKIAGIAKSTADNITQNLKDATDRTTTIKK